ncbi:MAG TPA: polyprenyl synthetase family protein [Spirochaetia bacterium]|nr:polyprenyl synthetase family protein [Spirochaetia bacterium]
MPTNTSITRVYEPIIEELSLVRNNIRRAIRVDDSRVDKVVSYVFKGAGKLLRPALTLFAGLAVKPDGTEGTPDKLIQLATAVELIHNASLVHDDVLDGSELRRDMQTLNRAYNTHIAVLTGDAIFTQAFYLMTHHLERETIEPLTRVTAGMCHAEIMNELHSGDSMDMETYLTIIQLKTAALMSAATEAGARVMGASPPLIKAMADYGMSIGIAYQLVDDYIDDETDSVAEFSIEHAYGAARRAMDSLGDVEDSVYKEKLIEMVELVIQMARSKDMSATPELDGRPLS